MYSCCAWDDASIYGRTNTYIIDICDPEKGRETGRKTGEEEIREEKGKINK